MTLPTFTRRSKSFEWLKERAGYEGDDCLIWPFGKNWNGYGHLKPNNERTAYAHRVMCELAHGEPPSPKHVATHSCHNGHNGCVSPRHLAWRLPRENLLDRRAAGTLTKKRWNNKGVVRDEDMELICLLKPFANQREIATVFGISYQHVSMIQRGKLKRQRKSA